MKTRPELLGQMVEAQKAVEEIRSKFAGKPGDMPGDDAERLERAMDDMLDAQSSIEKLDKFEAAAKFLRAPAAGHSIVGGNPIDTRAIGDEEKLFRAYLRGDQNAGLQLRAANSTQTGISGGVLVPTAVQNELIVPDEYPLFMRQISRVQSVSSLVEVPTLTSRITASWEGEIATPTATNPVFGARGYKPQRLTATTALSRLLVQMGAINVEAEIGEEFNYQFNVAEETAFMSGTGVKQPLGVFTADANGVTTAQDIETVTTSVIAPDDIIGFVMDLPSTYRNRSSWVANRTFVKACAKFKDSNNQYIWSMSMGIGNVLVGGAPSQLYGRPLYESEFAPSALTAGSYVAVLGDFRHYRIFDFLNIAVQVLDQSPYAEAGTLGYVGHRYVDGNVDLAQAFRRLKVKS